MTVWTERPPETAALFNPALLAVLCARIAEGWTGETGEPLPIPIVFPACALLLHADARAALPDTRRTRLAHWIERHGRERLEVADLAIALAPRVREAMRLGLRHALLVPRAPGIIGSPPPTASSGSAETRLILSRAPWVGGWLALGGTATTVLALLGVTR